MKALLCAGMLTAVTYGSSAGADTIVPVSLERAKFDYEVCLVDGLRKNRRLQTKSSAILAARRHCAEIAGVLATAVSIRHEGQSTQALRRLLRTYEASAERAALSRSAGRQK